MTSVWIVAMFTGLLVAGITISNVSRPVGSADVTAGAGFARDVRKCLDGGQGGAGGDLQ